MKDISPKTAKTNVKRTSAYVPVEVDQRKIKESSFAAQVTDLEVGETAMKNVPVESDWQISDFIEQIAGWRESLRGSIASTIRLAKSRTGGTYNVEVTDLFMGSGRLFIVAVVTRTT